MLSVSVLNGTLKDVLLAVQPRRTAAASFDHLVGAGEQRRRISIPSALAVLRLMTSSNLVGCSTRMSGAKSS
jgi:hypothetical protein